MPKKKESTTKSTSKKKKTLVAKAPAVEELREAAYYIWETKGCPENTTLDNWIEAEKQLCN